MRYYMFQNNAWQQVQVEIEPKYSKAFDTTNDTLSCVLKANNIKDAYLPMTPFKIEEDVGNDVETAILWINNDTVDIFSLRPLRYKHTLSLVQYRYYLNKHLVRNTVFNQPRKKKIQLYGATSSSLHIEGTADSRYYFDWYNFENSALTHEPNYWSDKISLTCHTKIKTFSFKMKLFVGCLYDQQVGADAGKFFEINSLGDNNVSLNENCYFEIVDIKNNNYSLGKIYISENLFNGENANPQMLEAINSYIANHSNAILALRYWADGVSSPYAETDFSFVKCISNVVEPAQIHGEMNPEYYTKTKYRFMTCQLFINLEIYNYTMYDVLDTLLKQNLLNSTNYGQKRQLLFNMPGDGTPLAQLLKSTYPKDTLSFTQATFYDALTEIFRYYDAGFKFDENVVLGIEYYNNPEKEITPTLVGRQTSYSDKNFNNGRVAHYQNAVLPIKIPRITVRSQSFGVPSSEDFGILLEKTIYDIGKVEVDVWGNFEPPTSANQDTFNVVRMKLDITPFIMNDSEWLSLDKADPDGYFYDDLTIRYQVDTLHFARGGRFINLTETYKDSGNQTVYFFDNVLKMAASRFIGYGICVAANAPQKIAYPQADTYTQQVFSIEYLTMNNGRCEVQTPSFKYNGQQIVNQNDGLIDLNKLGLNILGESLKDGEPTLIGSCTITDWEHRIKEGDYFVENGAYWVANVVSYTEIAPGKYRCSVEFSKNFNALSLKVNSDKEKRLTSVSSENAVLSEDNYIDYVYVCLADEIADYTSEEIVLNETVLADMMAQTFKEDISFDVKDIKFGVITTYDILNNVNEYGDSQEASLRYIPILKYGLGNCVCFEAQFNDALSAGNQLTVSSGYFGSNKYFSSAALYTDDEGWADKIDFAFCDLYSEGEKNNIGNFPVIESSTYNSYINEVARISKLSYFKKPNEIFALNYEWCFLVPKNKVNKLFIGSKFINENIFTNREAISSKSFYLKLSPSGSSDKYSILDTKGLGNVTVPIENVVFDVDTTNHTIKIGFQTAVTYYGKAWAVVDENNDIYFASNDPAFFRNLISTYQIGFFFSKTRKDL